MTLPFPDDWISAWLDDELVGEDRARFEAELEENAALREQVEGLRRIGDRLRDMPTHRLPPDFAAHVAALATASRPATRETRAAAAAAPLPHGSQVDVSHVDGGAAGDFDGATGKGRRRGGWYAAISIIGSLAALLLLSLSISGPLSRSLEKSVAFGTTDIAPASAAPKLAEGAERGFDAPAAPTMAVPLASVDERADSENVDRTFELRMNQAEANSARAVEATEATAPDSVASGVSQPGAGGARGRAIRATDSARPSDPGPSDASAMPLEAMRSVGGSLGNGPVVNGRDDLALGVDRHQADGGFGLGGLSGGGGGFGGGGLGGGMGGLPAEPPDENEALVESNPQMYFVDPLLRSNLAGDSRRQRVSGIADEPSDPTMLGGIARSTEGPTGTAASEQVASDAEPARGASGAGSDVRSEGRSTRGAEATEAEGERRIASTRGGANAPAVPGPAGGPIRGATEPNGDTRETAPPGVMLGGIPGGGREGLQPGGLLGGAPLIGGAGGLGGPGGLGDSNDAPGAPNDADGRSSSVGRYLERGELADDYRFLRDDKFDGLDARPIEALWVVVLDDAEFERLDDGGSPIVRLIKGMTLDETDADLIAPAEQAELRMLEVIDTPERIGDLYAALEADWKVATYRIELSRLERDEIDRFGRFDVGGESSIAGDGTDEAAPDVDSASEGDVPEGAEAEQELVEVDRAASENDGAEEGSAEKVALESEVRASSEAAREKLSADSITPLDDSDSRDYWARMLSPAETSWFGLLSFAEDLSRPETERLADRHLGFGDARADRSDSPSSGLDDAENDAALDDQPNGVDGTPSGADVSGADVQLRFLLLDDSERLARRSSSESLHEEAEVAQATGRRSRLLIVLRRSPTADRGSSEAAPAAPIDDPLSAPPPAADRDDRDDRE